MAGSSAVLSDNSTLSRLDRSLLRLEQFFALISGITIFLLMLLAVWSVTGRNVFNSPLMGYVDWIEQAMPLIAFMGMAYTQREGGHIRMDILVGRLTGRPLWAAELLSTLLILALVLLLMWGSWAHFARSFDWAAPLYSRDSSIDIGLPLWPAKLLAPIAYAVMALRLALQSWGYGAALVGNLQRPVAVPLVLDVAAQAAAEAEHIQGRD